MKPRRKRVVKDGSRLIHNQPGVKLSPDELFTVKKIRIEDAKARKEKYKDIKVLSEDQIKHIEWANDVIAEQWRKPVESEWRVRV